MSYVRMGFKQLFFGETRIEGAPDPGVLMLNNREFSRWIVFLRGAISWHDY